MPIRALACLVALHLVSALPAAAQPRVRLFTRVAGEIRRVVVESGDTLVAIGARNGIPWRALASMNAIEDPSRIFPGQVLEVDTRRVVPAVLDDGAVVNLPEAALYFFEAGSLVSRYPVGLGRPAWPTPVGSFTVLFGQTDPTWHVPSSIQEEMQREGRIVRRKVPPGPDNPLGKHWIQLSAWGYGIHGTPFPTTVGQFLSHGCIRVGEGNIEDIYRRVRKGTRVENVYLPVKVALVPNGEIWAEAHPDVYGLGAPALDDALEVIEREGLFDRLDESALERVLRERLGVARKVGAPVAASAAGGSSPLPGDSSGAWWRCLDCPPGPSRRVTFQIEAREDLDLPNPFPIEILDDAGRPVFRPQMVTQAIVRIDRGATRNFVWEVRDTEGQPLPPGSYSAVVRFFSSGGGEERRLVLPLWVGN